MMRIEVPEPRRLESLRRDGWTWLVRSFYGSEFMLETVHKDDHSRDMEVDAATRCGRWTVAVDLRQFDRQ